MEKQPLKVNAKMFLKDFREGKSDEELMRLHGLTPRLWPSWCVFCSTRNFSILRS